MIAQRRSRDSRPETTASEKEENLRVLMREMRKVLVAYSGGVDSTYLALIATQELGANAVCVLGTSPSVSEFQRGEAAAAAAANGFDLRTVETAELEDPNYASNPQNRCYYCKTELYGKLKAVADDIGALFVLDGTNADDLGDHRPGRAAARERSVRSPLAELGFTKADIREMSRVHSLATWDKPASPCLSSRIAYGVPVTRQRLSKIERAEDVLRRRGFREFRVRVHDDLARIAVAPGEMPTALEIGLLSEVAAAFKEIGFRYVTLDLEGFRSGGLNAAAAGVMNNKEE